MGSTRTWPVGLTPPVDRFFFHDKLSTRMHILTWFKVHIYCAWKLKCAFELQEPREIGGVDWVPHGFEGVRSPHTVSSLSPLALSIFTFNMQTPIYYESARQGGDFKLGLSYFGPSYEKLGHLKIPVHLPSLPPYHPSHPRSLWVLATRMHILISKDYIDIPWIRLKCAFELIVYHEKKIDPPRPTKSGVSVTSAHFALALSIFTFTMHMPIYSESPHCTEQFPHISWHFPTFPEKIGLEHITSHTLFRVSPKLKQCADVELG
jgi:hypothetical protein